MKLDDGITHCLCQQSDEILHSLHWAGPRLEPVLPKEEELLSIRVAQFLRREYPRPDRHHQCHVLSLSVDRSIHVVIHLPAVAPAIKEDENLVEQDLIIVTMFDN